MDFLKEKYEGWCLADLLFPPECHVLYLQEGNGIYHFWNADGEKQVVVEDWVVAELERRLTE